MAKFRLLWGWGFKFRTIDSTNLADVCCEAGAIYSELFGHMDFLPNVCVHLYLQLQGEGLGRAGVAHREK
jgi:hypothetical protein